MEAEKEAIRAEKENARLFQHELERSFKDISRYHQEVVEPLQATGIQQPAPKAPQPPSAWSVTSVPAPPAHMTAVKAMTSDEAFAFIQKMGIRVIPPTQQVVAQRIVLPRGLSPNPAPSSYPRYGSPGRHRYRGSPGRHQDERSPMKDKGRSPTPTPPHGYHQQDRTRSVPPLERARSRDATDRRPEAASSEQHGKFVQVKGPKPMKTIASIPIRIQSSGSLDGDDQSRPTVIRSSEESVRHSDSRETVEMDEDSKPVKPPRRARSPDPVSRYSMPKK